MDGLNDALRDEVPNVDFVPLSCRSPSDRCSPFKLCVRGDVIVGSVRLRRFKLVCPYCELQTWHPEQWWHR